MPELHQAHLHLRRCQYDGGFPLCGLLSQQYHWYGSWLLVGLPHRFWPPSYCFQVLGPSTTCQQRGTLAVVLSFVCLALLASAVFSALAWRMRSAFIQKQKQKTSQAQHKPTRNAIRCGQLDLWHTSVLFYFANLHFASRCVCLHLRGRLCSRPVIYYRGAV